MTMSSTRKQAARGAKRGHSTTTEPSNPLTQLRRAVLRRAGWGQSTFAASRGRGEGRGEKFGGRERRAAAARAAAATTIAVACSCPAIDSLAPNPTLILILTPTPIPPALPHTPPPATPGDTKSSSSSSGSAASSSAVPSARAKKPRSAMKLPFETEEGYEYEPIANCLLEVRRWAMRDDD